MEQVLLSLSLKFTINTGVPVLPYCLIAGIQEGENTPWYMFFSLKTETFAAGRKLASKHSYNNKSLCEMSRHLMSPLISSKDRRPLKRQKTVYFPLVCFTGHCRIYNSSILHTETHRDTDTNSLPMPPTLFSQSFNLHHMFHMPLLLVAWIFLNGEKTSLMVGILQL